MAFKHVKPPASPKPKRAPGRKLKGMSEIEKKLHAADHFRKKLKKKAHDKAKKDSFGFTIKRGRPTSYGHRGKIVEQGT